MQVQGISGTAIPDTRGVPLPRGRDSRDDEHLTVRLARPKPASSGWWRRPSDEEFTPQQLADAGYHVPAAKTTKAKRAKAPAKDRSNGFATHQRTTRRIPAAEAAAIVQAYRDGATIARIGRDTGRAHTTIRRALVEAGVELDTARRAHTLTPAQAEQALELRRQGRTIADVAAQVGAPAATVARALKPHGLDGTRVRSKTFDHAAAVEQYLAGASSTDVGKTHGASGASVLAAVRAAGHQPRPVGSNPHRAVSDDEAQRIVQAYRDGQSIPEIAQATSRGTRTVRRALLAADVQLRDDRATRSGGQNRHPAEVLQTAGDLYVSGLTRLQVAERLGIHVRVVDKGIQHVGATPRPAAHLPGGSRSQGDGARALKDLMAAHDITASDVRRWAVAHGHDVPTRGLVPRSLVEAYLLLRPLDRTA